MGKYYVLCSGGVGGAEKRFADICMAQAERGDDVNLVAPTVLLRQLFNEQELLRYRPFISEVLLERWNKMVFLAKFVRWFISEARPDYTYHYPLNPFFFLHLRRRNMVVSLCDCTRVPGSPRHGLVGVLEWGALRCARSIDVLSPTVYGSLKATHPTRNISLTPGGTFVRRSGPLGERVNREKCTVIFLGRLLKNKGVGLFLEAARRVASSNLNRSRFTFLIFGDGPLREELQQNIPDLQDQGIDIAYRGFAGATEALSAADVVCSLQESTNYPSRVVAEALLAGRTVVVTDTGDTRCFGNLPGLLYCEHDPDAVAQRIFEAADSADQDTKRLIEERARETFSSDSYLDYMASL